VFAYQQMMFLKSTITIQLLKKAAKKASAKAISENKTLNLPITYLQGKQIIKSHKGIKKIIGVCSL
jgi:hypothetical protein